MSARSSRRAFLSTGGAAIATAGATVPALATAPDPIFALIEAERVAFDAWGDAIDRKSQADEAFYASGFSRKARVQIGESVPYYRDGVPLPAEDRVAAPIYAHDRWEIDRQYQDEEVRARLYAELDADQAAIHAAEHSPEMIEAEAATDEGCSACQAKFYAVLDAVPTTAAGFMAALDLVAGRDCFQGDEGHLEAVLAFVRAFHAGRA